jgi:hypothetical protein
MGVLGNAKSAKISQKTLKIKTKNEISIFAFFASF